MNDELEFPCLCGHPHHNGPCPECPNVCVEYEAFTGSYGRNYFPCWDFQPGDTGPSPMRDNTHVH
jgi:hypothetical protein